MSTSSKTEPPIDPWTRQDMLVVAGAFGIAAVLAAAAAALNAPKIQSLVGLLVILALAP